MLPSLPLSYQIFLINLITILTVMTLLTLITLFPQVKSTVHDRQSLRRLTHFRSTSLLSSTTQFDMLVPNIIYLINLIKNYVGESTSHRRCHRHTKKAHTKVITYSKEICELFLILWLHTLISRTRLVGSAAQVVCTLPVAVTTHFLKALLRISILDKTRGFLVNEKQMSLSDWRNSSFNESN